MNPRVFGVELRKIDRIYQNKIIKNYSYRFCTEAVIQKCKEQRERNP